jgi:hypothetical protein
VKEMSLSPSLRQGCAKDSQRSHWQCANVAFHAHSQARPKRGEVAEESRYARLARAQTALHCGVRLGDGLADTIRRTSGQRQRPRRSC